MFNFLNPNARILLQRFFGSQPAVCHIVVDGIIMTRFFGQAVYESNGMKSMILGYELATIAGCILCAFYGIRVTCLAMNRDPWVFLAQAVARSTLWLCEAKKAQLLLDYDASKRFMRLVFPSWAACLSLSLTYMRQELEDLKRRV